MKVILYRYMGSHCAETLRNGWFMVSKPSKFRNDWSATAEKDETECMPQLTDDPDMKAQSVWPYFLQNFNEKFADPATMNDQIRILCLSDPKMNNGTDLYMWQRYAGEFSGARIGLELEIDENGECEYDDFYGSYVKYVKNPNVIHTSDPFNTTDLANKCFAVLFRKDESLSKNFYMESEFRLLISNHRWIAYKNLDYLRICNSMIVTVDVGAKMPPAIQAKIQKICRRNYSLRRFAIATNSGGRVGYTAI